VADAPLPEKYGWAVSLMRRLERARDALRPSAVRRLWEPDRWPPLPGAYRVGDPSGAVAVCVLTDGALADQAARWPGVAIAGRVFTANLGIERIILNLTANARIRFLVLCGLDSRLFQPGQTLKALGENGISAERRIMGAQGYLPVLAPTAAARVERFRQQVRIVDLIGERDPARIQAEIEALAKSDPGPLAEEPSSHSPAAARFKPISPGGTREPLSYDPKGFFVISTDRRQIVVHHYTADREPAYEMRGRGAESLVLGLLREGLVSQLSHAAYLGGELAKAEAAVRTGLIYEQDRPLGRN
jgi:tetrahydromethanopterin S-methyltransferase subunit A